MQTNDTRTQTIVIASVNWTLRGQRPGNFVRTAAAFVWLLQGTEADVGDAHAYAKTIDAEAVRVYTFDVTEGDPLGKARAGLLAEQGA